MAFELLVATNNAHKLAEIKEILSPYGVQVYGMKDLNIVLGDIEENGSSYYENALIKANALKKLTALPIIADDSGIEIESLDWKPGLLSARFADSFGGHDKAIEYILEKTKEKRGARFICDIVLVNVKDEPIQFEAVIEGTIATKVMGNGGFGYDPIFIENNINKTYAEMSEEEKNLVSHRGVALRKFVNYLLDNGYIKK